MELIRKNHVLSKWGAMCTIETSYFIIKTFFLSKIIANPLTSEVQSYRAHSHDRLNPG